MSLYNSVFPYHLYSLNRAVVLGYVYPSKLQSNLYTEQPDEGEREKRKDGIGSERNRFSLLYLIL